MRRGCGCILNSTAPSAPSFASPDHAFWIPPDPTPAPLPPTAGPLSCVSYSPSRHLRRRPRPRHHSRHHYRPRPLSSAPPPAITTTTTTRAHALAPVPEPAERIPRCLSPSRPSRCPCAVEQSRCSASWCFCACGLCLRKPLQLGVAMMMRRDLANTPWTEAMVHAARLRY